MPALLMLMLAMLRLLASSAGQQELHIKMSPLRHLNQLFYARSVPINPTTSPAHPPELSAMTPLEPASVPYISPQRHVGPVSKHHWKMPRAVPPTSFAPTQGQDCNEFSCSDPLTEAPIGSPCGCVYPMQVTIDLGVPPYQLFSSIQELEIEVAAGTYMKQSQVRIMGANASIRDPVKTTVTIALLPLGDNFDSMTAFLTYQRFWQKKVLINTSLFGDYEVIDVHYPGLPSAPLRSGGAFGPSKNGSQQYPFTADVHTGNSRKLKSITIAIIALSSFIFVLICLGAICILLNWKIPGKPPSAVGPALSLSVTKRSAIRSIISSSIASSTSMSLVSTMGTCRTSVKRFSLAELEKATDKFSPERILGEGGFGCVYHGIMEDESEVAVKLITREDQNGDREFIAEVEMLSRLHHRNLVKLIGICIEGRRRCLVYELIRNGSVESHLHGSDKSKGSLDWDARMKIALGAARALAYLHEDSNPRVIHRDFKASNVLLEIDFTPKVSDFGLAREASEGSHHISTQVMGTFGYVAPEYAMTGHLLVKSDVYSYGVVLLELLSGRKPVYMSQSEGPENLVTWARPLLTSREGLEQLIDPSLQGNYDFDNVAKVAAIASMCVHIEASQRPFMGEVVQALKLICNDMDETCEDSYSQRDESSALDCDFRGDLDLESGWWNGCTPRLTYGYASSFITVEYGSGPMEDIQRPHSTNTLTGRIEAVVGHNSSGPLRTKRSKSAFYRLRGSVSEHGHLSRRLGF